MTVTLSSAGGSSVPNWTLLQTSAPSGVATVTFSGLSGYSKYRVMTTNLTVVTGTPAVTATLNGDSGANYFLVRNSNGATGPTGVMSNTNLAPSISVSTTAVAWVAFEIENALNLSPKFYTFSGTFTTNGFQGVGIYQTTSLLTSLSLITASSTFNAGSIYLLGAN